MAETPDSLFLKAAVSRSLLGQDVAKEVYQASQQHHRPASELLVERGILTSHQVELVKSEVAKAQGPKVVAGFEIRSKLGQGGMGAVYRAIQLSIGREVALKVMAPEVAKNKGFAERFLREAMAMGAINHPNVITCFDAGQDGKLLYMALELMTGGDADQLAKAAGGILPPLRACEIVRDGAAGLVAIAKAGLIHRDIKPANIFLGENGNAKLADLGLARHEDGDDQMTRTGTAMGTPAFMSPEQAEGVADLDIRSDIYALGATLFALSTGHPPYAGPSAYAVVAKVINDPLPDPRSFNPHVPEPVVQLIRSAMHKDRRKRPQQPLELQQQLERVIGELQRAGLTSSTSGALPPELLGNGYPTPLTHLGSAGQSNRQHRTSESMDRSRKPLVIGGALALGALIVGGILFSRAGHEPVAVATPAAPVTTPAVVAPATISRPVASAPKDATPAVLKIVLVPNDPWPAREQWNAAVATLAPESQVATVAKAIHALNPRFSGSLRPQLNLVANTVTGMELDGVGVTDLRPLSALSQLRELFVNGGTAKQKVGLYDLTPLASLKLQRLRIPHSMVDNLESLTPMLLADVDLTGTAVQDLTPVLKPELRKLAFPYASVAEPSITQLRTLANVKYLGQSWNALVPAATAWAEYDAGGFPGSRPVAVSVAKETPPTASPAPAEPPATDPATAQAAAAVVEKPAPRPPLALRAIIIPDGASAKVRDAAKNFNDATRSLLTTMTQKRKEALKQVTEALTKDWKREAQLLSKDDSRLPIFDALKAARQALEAGAGPNDPAFANEQLPEATRRACADWRNTMEPLEQSAAPVVDEQRQRAINDLKPLADDPKSGAAAVLEQLEAMKPAAVQQQVVVDPLPVEGAVWRIDCMSALPRDQFLRDHTGVQGPARVTGDLWETSYGKALRGDGRSTQATTSLRRPLTDRTLMCWANPATFDQLGAGVISLQAPDGRAEAIALLDNGRLWGVLNDNRRSLASEKYGHGNGEWTHLALSVAGPHRSLYINGNLAIEDNTGAGSFPAGSELVIGRRGLGREISHFAGLLDGAVVFERALNATEINTMMAWQARQGELIRSTRRAREWQPLPVANGDFSKIIGNRAAEWMGRMDGVSFPTEDNGRFLRLELEKFGQEPRALRQVIRLDPSWREVRFAARIRLPAALDDSKADWQSTLGVQLIFVDPAKQLPDLRRQLWMPETPKVNSWLEVGRDIGWTIPAGYQWLVVECSLRGYLGRLDIDDATLSVLPGRP